jgi:hypothetical protein
MGIVVKLAKQNNGVGCESICKRFKANCLAGADLDNLRRIFFWAKVACGWAAACVQGIASQQATWACYKK